MFRGTIRVSYVIAALFCCCLFADDYDDISKLDIVLPGECEPLATVAGCINVASGHFFQVEQDLVSNTIDPISLTRFYDSHSEHESFLGTGFGCQFPLMASDYQKGVKHTYAMISERDGFLMPYRGRSTHAKTICQVDPRLLQKGYTNAGQEISSRTNFANWEAIWTTNPTGNYWTVVTGDGTRRSYRGTASIDSKKRMELSFPTKQAFLLTREVKPNGNKILFEYTTVDGKPCLSQARTLNREDVLLNELKFTYTNQGCEVISSCGRKAEYSKSTRSYLFLKNGDRFPKTVDKKVLKSVHSTRQGTTLYSRNKRPKIGVFPIDRVEKEDGRLLTVSYGSKNDKVSSLQEPLGLNGAPITTYSFEYGKSSTTVFDALNQRSVFHFDKYQRLTKVEDFDQLQGIRQKVYEWSAVPEQEGWLTSKSIRVGTQVFHSYSYDYDSKGNVVRKTLFGNLTGERADSFQVGQLQATDRYSIDYAYSNDKRNLLIQESTPQGWIVHYDYLPGTNLCTKELHVYNHKVQERFFYAYDANGEEVLSVEDDGSGADQSDLADVTYRRVKVTHRETTQGIASFGKPRKIEDYYIDPNTKQLILKNTTELTYNAEGNEISQKVYDLAGTCFEKTQAYDHRQRVIEKTDFLGQVTRYQYDRNNNKTHEEQVGSGKSTTFTYDLGNRLISKSEYHDNGEILTTTYTYNPLSQLTSETDHFGNTTTHYYDRLGCQVQTVKPPMEHESGRWITPSVRRTFNVLGQCIVEKDENDCTTFFSYNTYGDLTKKIYPDGATERYAYYPCGWLKQKWAPDGTSIRYCYDAKGRIALESHLDTNGWVATETSYVYKGNLLQSKTDRGLTTTYLYDGAGRKIEENCGQVKIHRIAYDSFDRIAMETYLIGDGDQAQCTLYQYDELDRVIAKTCCDQDEKIFAKETYAYDRQGKCIQKTVWKTDDEASVYTSYYDSQNNLLWKEDPLGNRTAWSYDNRTRNAFGQYVQSRTKTDSLGREESLIYDAYQRVVSKKLYADNKLLSEIFYTYDPCGRLVKQLSLVKEEGTTLREYDVRTHYNTRGLLSEEIELPQGKTTTYSYNAAGRLVKECKPDGVSLSYTYDAEGRLFEKTSSDGSIGYRYVYDLRDNPVQIIDTIRDKTLNRSYDRFDRLVEEEPHPGSFISYEYDALDRVTKLTLPDGSMVAYRYDPYHLKTVQRFKPSGVPYYEYQCQDYDLKGCLLKGTYPGGQETRTYDLLGRPITIQTPGWEMQAKAFDSVGNLLTATYKDPTGILEGHYTYDAFNHLLTEDAQEVNRYTYDSLGNVLEKNDKAFAINDLNQIDSDGDTQYHYDLNGNLILQDDVPITYSYDALNRLIEHQQAGIKTTFAYDAFGRCLTITENSNCKQLLYLHDKEIGSMVDGKLTEFRTVHPSASQEKTFAIEIGDTVFYPVQDYTTNVCGLRQANGSLIQWYRYSAFGHKQAFGNLSLKNPWGFANRREIAGLSLFTHRFYNPNLMRWQTTDPLSFEEGLNLYNYVFNNPFVHRDPDGQAVILLFLPLLAGTFTAGEIAFFCTSAVVIAETCVAAAASYGIYKSCEWASNRYQCEKAKSKEEDNPDGKWKKKKYKMSEDSKRFHTDPQDLTEQLTLEEAKSERGKRILEEEIKDPRYPKDKWKKVEHTHKRPKTQDLPDVHIHWWEEISTGKRHGYKFKEWDEVK